MRADRPGVALIEVLASVTLLSLAGIGFLALLGQTSHTMRTVRDTERQSRAASAELSRLVLLERKELQRLVGVTHVNGFTLRVTERTPGLFDAALAPSDTSNPLLWTTIYRLDTTHVGP